MKRIDSLISLVRSLTKAERKAFALRCDTSADRKEKSYAFIYRLIAGNNLCDSKAVKEQFLARYPGGAFEVEVKYLYDKLTDTLMGLRAGKDVSYSLLRDIGKARMFFDRSLFEDCFELTASVISRARRLGLNEIMLLAQKLELEFLLTLDFPDMSERDLFEKHTLQKKTLKSIGLVTEHASLYNILRQRMLRIGSIHTPEQRKMMADLVMSEFYSFSAEPEKTFELERNHRMFQASYLMETGDIRGALNVYSSLHQLFDANHENPASTPTYHLSVLEGILRALRFAGRYSDMAFFLERLRKMSGNASADMRANILCLIFQYELVPHLDTGDFEACRDIVARYREPLIDKDVRPIPVRECELQLYSALVELGLGNWKKVSRIIARAMVNQNIKYLPLMRTIRLVRLMAYYELGEHDLLQYEARSISRSSGKLAFATERMMLRFLTNAGLPPMQRQRLAIWDKMRPSLQNLSADIYERQLLSIFDFTAWIEAKLTGISLSVVLSRKADMRGGPV